MNFDLLLNLLRRFWPVLRARVAAWLATQIVAIAARFSVALTEEDALDIAVAIIGFIEPLLQGIGSVPVSDALVARAAARLSATTA